MFNKISLIVVFLILILISILIVLSLNNIKNNPDKKDYQDSTLYPLTGNIFFLLVLLSLYNIYFYNLMISLNINDILSIVITLFGGNMLIGLLGILPVLTLSDKYSTHVTKYLKFYIRIVTYIFIPISFVYLLFRNLTYKPSITKMTEDEFLDIIEKAELEEGINESDRELIKSVLDFDDLKVLDIYTPRTDIIAVDDKMTTDEIVDVFKSSGYSRLPVYTNSLDTIIGTINHKDFYNKVYIDKNSLESIIIKSVEVPEYMVVKNLLTLLKINKSHMAIVKDEYGGTLGIVTMEDVLEELVGDIFDEHDKEVNNIFKLDNQKYNILGSTYLDEIEDLFDLEELEEEDYSTVNGWVLANLGKMGKPGDSFTYKNLLVVVKQSNNKMVLEVEITILD